ncbi:hypothetical protein [Botrimarina sp.]|uniref:hypothetical protein n=1 Tax=Botrimarina sp. TaxID=2795802 RepID=UPI0032ED2E03
MHINYGRPLLRVRTTTPYVEFFERVLGFSVTTSESGDMATDDYAILSRGSMSFAFVRHVLSTDEHTIEIGVSSIDDAVAELNRRGFDAVVSVDVTEGAFAHIRVADQLLVEFEQRDYP